MTQSSIDSPVVPSLFPDSFAAWRDSLAASDTLPVIAVAGSRGKTTVACLLREIFVEAGLRGASWTDAGVEVDGRRQRGELVPWSRTLDRLGSGDLDVAVQELDWITIGAVGLPKHAYPIIAITNICGNSDSCLLQADTQRSINALGAVGDAVLPSGALVLNGDDLSVAADERLITARRVLVGLSRDAPLLRQHLARGGTAAWVGDDGLAIGHGGTNRARTLCAAEEVALSLHGVVGFELHNALTAATAALACGIRVPAIAAVLRRFTAPARAMPGSFNVVPIGGAIAIVDRPAPSWYLRSVLRAVAHLPHRRLLAVVGRLDAVPAADLTEVGRLVGRAGGALILHGEAAAPARAAAFRQGIALNSVPPVMIHLDTERRAIDRALKMVRPDDLLLVLADQPASVLRTLDRAHLATQNVQTESPSEGDARPAA